MFSLHWLRCGTAWDGKHLHWRQHDIYLLKSVSLLQLEAWRVPLVFHFCQQVSVVLKQLLSPHLDSGSLLIVEHTHYTVSHTASHNTISQHSTGLYCSEAAPAASWFQLPVDHITSHHITSQHITSQYTASHTSVTSHTPYCITHTVSHTHTSNTSHHIHQSHHTHTILHQTHRITHTPYGKKKQTNKTSKQTVYDMAWRNPR